MTLVEMPEDLFEQTLSVNRIILSITIGMITYFTEISHL